MIVLECWYGVANRDEGTNSLLSVNFCWFCLRRCNEMRVVTDLDSSIFPPVPDFDIVKAS